MNMKVHLLYKHFTNQKTCGTCVDAFIQSHGPGSQSMCCISCKFAFPGNQSCERDALGLMAITFWQSRSFFQCWTIQIIVGSSNHQTLDYFTNPPLVSLWVTCWGQNNSWGPVPGCKSYLTNTKTGWNDHHWLHISNSISQTQWYTL